MARFFADNWEDYELIDAGNNQKLERWGNVVTIRPERNAYFTPVLSLKEWKKEADFIFNEVSHTRGNWEVLNANAPAEWKISYKNLIFNLKLTKFKHVGLFPEQVLNWDFISSKLSTSSRFLNLFGYTGGASLMARKSGAEVYHCDSVRQINAWAKSNMEDSSLDHIRWVLDDALKFAQRELKRGNKYDGIIMDPPAFGIGAKKERWKIEDKFPELLETTTGLLVNNGFLIANTYSPRLDAKKIKAYASSVVKGKTIEIGTLSRKTTTGKILEYGELTRIY